MLPGFSQLPQINGLYCNKVEYSGIAEIGPYHWRQIYMLRVADYEKLAAGEDLDALFVYYELLSNKVDMDQLLTVAEHMR